MRADKNLLRELRGLKRYERESYADVVKNLIDGKLRVNKHEKKESFKQEIKEHLRKGF